MRTHHKRTRVCSRRIAAPHELRSEVPICPKRPIGRRLREICHLFSPMLAVNFPCYLTKDAQATSACFARPPDAPRHRTGQLRGPPAWGLPTRRLRTRLPTSRYKKSAQYLCDVQTQSEEAQKQ